MAICHGLLFVQGGVLTNVPHGGIIQMYPKGVYLYFKKRELIVMSTFTMTGETLKSMTENREENIKADSRNAETTGVKETPFEEIKLSDVDIDTLLRESYYNRIRLHLL